MSSPESTDKVQLTGDGRDDAVITWDGPTDSNNPQNWTDGRKWLNVILVSIQGTLSPICSTVLALGSQDVAFAFHLHDAYTPALPVALYVLGLGIGPLFLAPLSEIYGRRIIYLSCFTVFTILNVGCALAPNIAALSILRLLSGMAGSAGPSLGGSSIGDMFPRERRGKAQALYGFGPTCGPVIGGVIGGFIVSGTGNWRWLMWVIVIASGVTVLFCLILQKETYGPFLLRKKLERLRKENPDRQYRTEFDVQVKQLLTAFRIYAILYLHLITITLLFSDRSFYGLFSYHWTGGTVGLAYLGAGTGSVIGTIICALFLNRSYRYTAARHEKRTGSAVSIPEFRLPFLQVGMIVTPIGLIIFGWSAEKQLHWAVPLFGALIFGLGMLMGYVCIQTYLVDAFEEYAASALAAAIVTRCVVSCVFTVVGFQLYRSLGYAWGSMLLALLCIAMTPIPFWLQHYGPKLRSKQFNF
ncbi:hypothetical protein CJF30_00000981 [Rutstroemia sp. NJR-2017a BBW]|nr:hypothetical protein CJF30_00000981 [Rutstroemia sp. NJR-2017a BBW]